MGLLSNLTGRREGGAPPAASPPPSDTVQAARAKARHRLIGAVVLLLMGIVGFPLVFETQPRPTPVDVAIEIPRKDNAPPLVVSAPRVVPPQAADLAPAPAATAASQSGVVKDHAAPAAPAASPATPARPPVAASPARPVTPPAERSTPAPAANPPATGAQEARYVVQIGAFADAAAAQVMRSKAEKLGLKTYTQQTDTATGNRVRVRIGPFATREAAELVLAKAKAGGLSAVVLTL